MKTRVMTLATLLILAYSANAEKWRVNNTPGVDADFTTFKAAHDGASAGDTIFLEGSPVLYGEYDTVFKKLVIIGPGYFLNENDTTQANVVPAKLFRLIFMPGSEGSILTGVTMENYLAISANNITICRNHLTNLQMGYPNSISNCIIRQNYLTYIVDNENVISAIIINNILSSYIGLKSGSSAIIENNIIYGGNSGGYGIQVYNSTIRNNILRQTLYLEPSANNLIQNNLSSVTFSDVFLMTGSSDGKYKLKDGSPAIGAGKDGVDCGAFGGSEPYVLSGIPSGPHIFDANVSTSGSPQSGLPVTLKIKTQN